MGAQRIQVGQIWRKDGTEDSYLVTKIYSEALATFAVLRKSGAENEAPLRVRVERSGAAQTLAGFSYSQQVVEP
jgi:hypothetical protein